jgi:hypothetical protein
LSEELEVQFPRLRFSAYKVTSPSDPGYNCIGWAAGDTSMWWEPDPMGVYFWPKSVPRRLTMDAFKQVFSALGYKPCEATYPEAGHEKVAIFADPTGTPTHAARQLSDGSWTSKMGKLEDIEHVRLEAVSGSRYGHPAIILRRPIKD